ncbi:MAG: hypothetical protein MHMPM18_001463 [Marteilia pararefringens]
MPSHEDIKLIVDALSSCKCSYIAAKLLTEYLKKNKHRIYDLSFFDYLINLLVFELEFSIAKQLLLVLAKVEIEQQDGDWSTLSQFCEFKSIQILFLEIFDVKKDGESRKRDLILSILQSKLKKFIVAHKSNKKDLYYLLSSLMHESKNYQDAFDILTKFDILKNKIKNDSANSLDKIDNLVIKPQQSLPTSIEHIHCLYLTTLSINLRKFDVVHENLQFLFENKLFDSSVIDAIFLNFEEPALLEDPNFMSFINDVESIIDGYTKEKDIDKQSLRYFEQFQLIFKFCQRLFELYLCKESCEPDIKKNRYSSIADTIVAYFEHYKTQPFCVYDISSFVTKLKIYSPDEGLKNLLPHTKIFADFDLLDEKYLIIDKDTTISTITQYMSECAMQIYFGFFDDKKAIHFANHIYIMYKNSLPLFGEDSENMYPFHMLIFFATTILEDIYVKTRNTSYAIIALALINNVLQNDISKDFFLFTVKKLWLANILNFPSMLEVNNLLNLADTQYDSLFFLFLNELRSPALCDNLLEMLTNLDSQFMQIELNTLEALNDFFNNDLILSIEDNSEFVMKTIKSKSKLVIHKFKKFANKVMDKKVNNTYYLYDMKPTADNSHDLCDYTILELFRPFTTLNTMEYINTKRFGDVIEMTDAANDGFMSFNNFFKKTYEVDILPAKFNENLEEIIRRKFPEDIAKCSPFISDTILLSLLYAKSECNGSKIAMQNHLNHIKSLQMSYKNSMAKIIENCEKMCQSDDIQFEFEVNPTLSYLNKYMERFVKYFTCL